METIKFKFNTLFSDLWKQSDKFEKIIRDDKKGYDSLSDDDCRVHTLLHDLLSELKRQKFEEYSSNWNLKRLS
tara:strand:- start:861 stop:1079 length:219 start_codon:yes stop_codon:yes gene_type:complete